MTTLLPYRVLTHKQRVLSLYKRSLRNLESYVNDRVVLRYQAVLLRDKFDKNKCITDEREAKKLLEDAEEELFQTMHPQPKKFTKSIGGNAYGRAAHTPDWVLDEWHPLEKAQYPEYFARREQRKKEYIKLWEKHYGPSTEKSHH